MDAFYASVEQHDDPALRGRPVIVGGRGPRSVVAAASYEARRHGVHSAMPLAQARRLCPEGIFLPVRMARYREASERVFEVLARFTPLVEPLSLDEAFLDVTEARASAGAPRMIAERLKREVREATGLTCSVGIGPNKLVAKIASDLHKPDGLYEVAAEAVEAFLAPLPVTSLWGIGERARQSLARLGIHTVGELRAASAQRLRPALGRHAEFYLRLAAGIDERPVVPDAADKSISSEETFERDLDDPAALERALLALTDEAVARVRRHGLEGSVVTLKVRTADFVTYTRQRRFSPPSAATKTVFALGRALLREWRAAHPGAAVRLLGIGLSDFTSGEQGELFASPETARSRALDAVADTLRARFGATAVRRGRT